MLPDFDQSLLTSAPTLPPMKPPTFTQLRERRELREVNPQNGVRFDISLADWQGALWAVRVRPEKLRPTDFDNPFVTTHRLLPRPVIEDWLAGLRLARPGRRNRLADRRA